MTPQEARVVPSHSPRTPFWACVGGASLAAVAAGGGVEAEPALSDAPEAHPARAVAITAPIMAAARKLLVGKRFEFIGLAKIAAAVIAAVPLSIILILFQHLRSAMPAAVTTATVPAA